jgi:hypothetical protein
VNWYRKYRDGRVFWIVIVWITAELVLGYGMVLGFWFTGVSR